MATFVTVSVRPGDFDEVYKSLKVTKRFEEEAGLVVVLEVEDVAGNFKELTTNPKVLDWEIYNNSNLQSKEDLTYDDGESIKPIGESS